MKLKTFTCAAAALLMMATAQGVSAQTADEETWKPIGNGLIRDDITTGWWFMGNYYEAEVEMQESEQTPGRYRLVNAYKNMPVLTTQPFPLDPPSYCIVDASDPAHVYIEPGQLGYWIGQDQRLIVWSIAHDYRFNEYGNWEKADQEGVCGSIDRGVITFPKGAILAFPLEKETFDPVKDELLWKTVNHNGMFRIKLPGVPNYDVKIDLTGYDEAKETVSYNVNLTSDMDYVLVALFPGEYTEDMADKIADGTVESIKVEKSGELEFPYTEDGDYTLVAVPYCKGEKWHSAYLTKRWAYSQAEWKKMGKATYTDAILSSNYMKNYGFMIPEYTYEVEVEQSVAEPWKIRLVDPYGYPQYPYATATNYDSSKPHYLQFDFDQFNGVRMKKMEDTGLNLSYGRMDLWSRLDRALEDPNFYGGMYAGITYEDAIANPELGPGTYDAATRTLTFPKNALYICFLGARPDTWYEANMNTNFKLVLPEGMEVAEKNATGVGSIDTDEPAEAEYYTLDGLKVAEPASGIYIKRQGNKTTKIYK